MKKLTRATVPMCPECGVKLSRSQAEGMVPHAGCRVIIGNHYAKPAYGLYVLDVAGVVKETRKLIKSLETYPGLGRSTAVVLRELVSRLEGSHE